MHESQDITKKVSKIGIPNQTSKILHILAGISGLEHIFQNRILDWKHESKPVDLNPMNPIFLKIVFTFKGVSAKLGRNLESSDLAEFFFLRFSYPS